MRTGGIGCCCATNTLKVACACGRGRAEALPDRFGERPAAGVDLGARRRPLKGCCNATDHAAPSPDIAGESWYAGPKRVVTRGWAAQWRCAARPSQPQSRLQKASSGFFSAPRTGLRSRARVEIGLRAGSRGKQAKDECDAEGRGDFCLSAKVHECQGILS